MAFNPALPADHATNSAAKMRGKFHGLRALIDALQSITAVQVDGVTMLDPGQAATVTLFLSGSTLHLTFGIPRGEDGINGRNDAQRPPFGTGADGMTTLNPGDPPTMTTTFDGTNVHFTFGIPRRADGVNGADGNNASTVVEGVTTLGAGQPATVTVTVTFDGSNVRFSFGIPRDTSGMNETSGNDGASGKLTNTCPDTAIATTVRNPAGVPSLTLTAGTDYDPVQIQTVADRFDELLAALGR